MKSAIFVSGPINNASVPGDFKVTLSVNNVVIFNYLFSTRGWCTSILLINKTRTVDNNY